MACPLFLMKHLPDAKLDLVLVEATPKTDVNPKGLLFRIKSAISSGPQEFQQDGLESRSKADINLPVDTGVLIQPDGNITVRPPNRSGNIQGDLFMKWTGKRKASPEPFIIIGQAGGSRFEVLEFILLTDTKLIWNGGENKATGKFKLEGSVNGCKIIIDASGGDGFLQKILPGSKLKQASILHSVYQLKMVSILEAAVRWRLTCLFILSLARLLWKALQLV